MPVEDPAATPVAVQDDGAPSTAQAPSAASGSDGVVPDAPAPVVLEAAVQLAQLEQPERTVRFAWWGAEEQGLVGSWHYVHEEETGNPDLTRLANVDAYLNFDMLASGNGLAFIHAGGYIIERELAPGEQLRVDTGCIVGFEESVDYEIKMIKGIKTMFFGGEGLFYAVLRGPGKIWIQTTPFSRFADRVMAAAGASQGEHKRGGNLIGSLLQGD